MISEKARTPTPGLPPTSMADLYRKLKKLSEEWASKSGYPADMALVDLQLSEQPNGGLMVRLSFLLTPKASPPATFTGARDPE